MVKGKQAFCKLSPRMGMKFKAGTAPWKVLRYLAQKPMIFFPPKQGFFMGGGRPTYFSPE